MQQKRDCLNEDLIYSILIMVNKIVEEVLTLIYKSDLSKTEKAKYSKVIMMTLRKFEIQTGTSFGDDQELMEKLLVSFEEKKEIIKKGDKVAWKNLMKEEENELENMITEDLKESEADKLEEIRAKLAKVV